MKKWTWLACFILLIASSENPDKATLYLYRQKEFLGTAYEIKVNGKFVASLASKSYLEIKISPGNTNIEASTYRGSKRNVSIALQANQIYHIRAYEEVDFWDRFLVMQVVDAAVAKQEMIKCRKNEKIKQPD